MNPRRYSWLDPQTRRVVQTDGATCPPGHLPFTGMLPDGYSLTVPFAMRDAAAGAGPIAIADVAGKTPLMHGAMTLNDALAACPADSRWIRDKVARSLLDAEAAGSHGAFDNAVAGLRACAQKYVTGSFMTKDQAGRDAYARAAQTLTGTIDALVTNRSGKASATSAPDPRGAYTAMGDRIANGWRA